LHRSSLKPPSPPRARAHALRLRAALRGGNRVVLEGSQPRLPRRSLPSLLHGRPRSEGWGQPGNESTSATPPRPISCIGASSRASSHGPGDVAEPESVGAACHRGRGRGYRLYYTGVDSNVVQQIGIATSTDLAAWATRARPLPPTTLTRPGPLASGSLVELPRSLRRPHGRPVGSPRDRLAKPAYAGANAAPLRSLLRRRPQLRGCRAPL